MSSSSTGDVVAVHILGLPVPLYRDASEHSDGLFREFALVLRGDADRCSVPARLLRLIDELKASFGAFTARPSAALSEALARGDDLIDLVYEVPVQAKEAALELSSLLDEADAFCRAGEHLLTLAAPPDVVAFRRWFLNEFAAQLDAAAPTSWSDFCARSMDVPAG